MGYTRYWERTDKPYDEEFIDEVKRIIAKCTQNKITICDGHGEGSPIVTMEKIAINGDGSRGLEHETFFIANPTYEHFETGFDFCKTALKPYDYAVREILKIAEEKGIVTNVSDDGENTRIISDYDFCKENVVRVIYYAFAFKNDISSTQKKICDEIYQLWNVDDITFEKLQELCKKDLEMDSKLQEYVKKYLEKQ